MSRITDTFKLRAHGELAGSATAVQMPSIAGKAVQFSTDPDNAGSVFVGLATSMTVGAGTTTTTAGLELKPGVLSPLFLLDGSLDELWRRCDNAGDDMTYMIYS